MSDNDFWNRFGTGLLSAGLGYLKSQGAIDAARDAAAAATSMDARRRAAHDLEAAQLMGLAPMLAAGYAMRPATVRTALASSRLDPNTGEVGYDLEPGAAGLFSRYMQGAKSALDQAGDFNPRTFAAERFAALQDLLAPVRAAEEAKLFRTLHAKGIEGLGSYEGSPTGAAQSPLAAALYGARAQADKKAAYEALREGEDYLDRLLKRSAGMFRSATDVEGAGRDTLRKAGEWTDRFSRSEREKAEAIANLMRQAYSTQRQGAYEPTAADRILNAERRLGSASAARRSGLFDALGDIVKNSGGLGGLFKGVSGLFSSGRSWFDSPRAPRLDDWSGADYSSWYDSPSMARFDDWSYAPGYASALDEWGTGSAFGNFDYADYF